MRKRGAYGGGVTTGFGGSLGARAAGFALLHAALKRPPAALPGLVLP